MELKLLFWNLRDRPLEALVAACAAEHQSHVVMLTECQIPPGKMLQEFARNGLPDFTFPSSTPGTEGDIRIFVRFPESNLRPVYDDVNNHVTIRRLILRGKFQLLLIVVHSQSKRWNDNDQLQGATRLARRIEEFEQKFSKASAILVGDLNMNPFEAGVVGSEGLHAVMTRDLALRQGRIVDGEHRRFFYNPMWRFFGERSGGPPGTYYYEASGRPTSYFWNMFDQVLVRPSLAEKLKDIRIVDRIGSQSLLDARKIPNVELASDHLPVVFSLNFE